MYRAVSSGRDLAGRGGDALGREGHHPVVLRVGAAAAGGRRRVAELEAAEGSPALGRRGRLLLLLGHGEGGEAVDTVLEFKKMEMQ